MVRDLGLPNRCIPLVSASGTVLFTVVMISLRTSAKSSSDIDASNLSRSKASQRNGHEIRDKFSSTEVKNNKVLVVIGA